MPEDFTFFPTGRPRSVRGGIRPHAQRGAFVQSWWGRRWIETLESFDIGTRLSRGKSYARKGQVVDINIDIGRVEATVQGSRRDPYKVSIAFKTIDEASRARLGKTASGQALIAARLLAGDMPEDLEKVFAQTGLSLFPERYNDLSTKCSCPDFSNPCKHIAAVYYLLAEEFDRDPFLILRLRGINKQNLISLIAGTTDGESSTMERASGTKGKTKRKSSTISAPVVAEKPDPLPSAPSEFWAYKLATDPVGAIKLPHTHAAILRRLGNIPFWRGSRDFMPTMQQIYRAASETAIDRLAGTTTRSDDEPDAI